MPLNIDTIHAAAVADDLHEKHDEATQSVFGQLAESTVGYKARDAWEKSVREIEVEYCEKVFKNKDGTLKDPDAMTSGRYKSDGTVIVAPRWKFRKVLPAAWSSSKSVCGQAIERGIKLDKDSRKTATEKAIAEQKKDEKDEKTPAQKFQIVMDTARKILGKLPENEREDILREYGIDPLSTNYSWMGE